MPQLNFTIPDALLTRIDAAKPNYLDRKGFLCLLIDQALDASPRYGYDLGKGGRGVGATGTQSETQEPQRSEAFFGSNEPNKSSSLKNKAATKAAARPRFVFSVPPDLEWCRDDLLEFWMEYKAGRKSRAAAALLIKGLREIEAKYGRKVVQQQLELAKAKAFESITLANYERYGLPRAPGGAYSAPEPAAKHPAGRLFVNGRFVDEDGLTTNPLLEGVL